MTNKVTQDEKLSFKELSVRSKYQYLMEKGISFFTLNELNEMSLMQGIRVSSKNKSTVFDNLINDLYQTALWSDMSNLNKI